MYEVLVRYEPGQFSRYEDERLRGESKKVLWPIQPRIEWLLEGLSYRDKEATHFHPLQSLEMIATVPSSADSSLVR